MEPSPIYQAAFNFLQARRQLKEAKQAERNLQQQAQHLRGILNDAFVKAKEQTTDDPAQDDLFSSLTSFSIVEGNDCFTLVFADGKLQSVIEGPIISS